MQDELRSRKLSIGRSRENNAESSETPHPIRAVTFLAFWLGHTLLGSLGIGIGVASFFYSIKIPLSVLAPSLAFHNALLIIPFFPLQTFAGALNGFVVARKKARFWRSQSAELAWILPGVLLAFLFYSNYSPFSGPSETRWQHFFWSASERSRALQLGATMPFLASACYSLAHFASRKLQTTAQTRKAALSCL